MGIGELVPVEADAEVGIPFKLMVSGNAAPGNFTATNIPPGLQLNSGSGFLEGVPNTSGVFFTVIEFKAVPPVRRVVEIRVTPSLFTPVPAPPTVPEVLPLVEPAKETPWHPETFFRFKEPCPVPGCEELRLLYRNELTKVSGCSGCARAALQQKYLNAYRKLGSA